MNWDKSVKMSCRNWFRLGCSMATALAFVQSVVSVVQECNKGFAVNPVYYSLSVLFVGILIFVVKGIWLDGYLVRMAVIKIRSIGIEIAIGRGDIFNQKGVSVVGVNDFFDTVVDDCHISGRSVHGQMIRKFWSRDVSDLNMQISDSLKDVPAAVVKRDGIVKENRYAIGTSAFVQAMSGERFILVALAETDPESHRTQSSMEMLSQAVRGALKVAREHANGDPVSFYLMGGGNARIKASDQMLLSTMLSAIITECLVCEKVSSRINIVLNGKSSVLSSNLHDLEKAWSM